MHIILYGVFLLLHCVLLESSDTTKRFREHYPPERQAKRFKQDTAREMLIQAVKNNDIQAAQKAFELGAHPDEIDKKGKYLFEKTYTKPALFKLFLEYGVNPDLGDDLYLYNNDGSEKNVGPQEFKVWHLPLFVALRAPNFENLDVLFTYGARFSFFTSAGIKTLASIVSRGPFTQQQKQKLTAMHTCDSQGEVVNNLDFIQRLYLAPGVLFGLPEDMIIEACTMMPQQTLLPLHKKRAIRVLCEPMLRNSSDSVGKYLSKMNAIPKEFFIKLGLSHLDLFEWYISTKLHDKDKVFALYREKIRNPWTMLLYKKARHLCYTDMTFHFFE